MSKDAEALSLAHNFLIQKGVRGMGEKHPAITIEGWLSEFAELPMNTTKWVDVTERMPPIPDEDYLVVVRNKNKEGGIPIQDIQNFTSDGVFVGGSPDVWENVVYWAELPKPPF